MVASFLLCDKSIIKTYFNLIIINCQVVWLITTKAQVCGLILQSLEGEIFSYHPSEFHQVFVELNVNQSIILS